MGKQEKERKRRAEHVKNSSRMNNDVGKEVGLTETPSVRVTEIGGDIILPTDLLKIVKTIDIKEFTCLFLSFLNVLRECKKEHAFCGRRVGDPESYFLDWVKTGYKRDEKPFDTTEGYESFTMIDYCKHLQQSGFIKSWTYKSDIRREGFLRAIILRDPRFRGKRFLVIGVDLASTKVKALKRSMNRAVKGVSGAESPAGIELLKLERYQVAREDVSIFAKKHQGLRATHAVGMFIDREYNIFLANGSRRNSAVVFSLSSLAECLGAVDRVIEVDVVV